MGLTKELFNLLAPHQCIDCQNEGSLLCLECSSRLVMVPPRCYKCGRWSDDFRTCKACRRRTSIHSLWAVTKYEGIAKELVHRLKFERAMAAAGNMAEILAAKCTAEAGTIVTYVPTASRRVRERGYDQAALVAKELARRLGLRFAPCLARSGQQQQVGNSREVRARQIRGAFRPLRASLFQNNRVLLVDDVLTTGATCEAAARVLRRAGAKRVSAAVFAVA